MQAYDLAEMAGLLGVPPSKIRNWTVGRPFKIVPSVRVGGQGSVNLYSLQDVYLMGIALELSRTGFAAKAIGKFIETAASVAGGLSEESIWTVWRAKAAGAFGIHPAKAQPPPRTLLSFTFQVGEVIKTINKRAGVQK